MITKKKKLIMPDRITTEFACYLSFGQFDVKIWFVDTNITIIFTKGVLIQYRNLF